MTPDVRNLGDRVPFAEVCVRRWRAYPHPPIFEADAAKGGASIEALKAECRESCVEVASPRPPPFLPRV